MKEFLLYSGFTIMTLSIAFGIISTFRSESNNKIMRNGVNISLIGIALGNLLVQLS